MKLNIGSGRNELKGYINIDRKLGYEAYPLPESIPVEDYSTASIECADVVLNNLDEIRASHVLEHLETRYTLPVLKHWADRLKAGGVLKIAVPDVSKAIAMTNDPNRFRYIVGGQIDDDDYHKAAFDRPYLEKLMTEAGLVDIEEWEDDHFDTHKHPVSLNLKGRKLMAEETIKVKAIMSAPRLGFMDHFGCVQDALKPFGIPLTRYGGAFWHHGMANGLQDCVDAGIDWVLTMDYDTLFEAEHIDILFRTMGSTGADAVCALQPKRNTDSPLVTVGDGKGGKSKQIDASKPFICETGHFGLTVIRTEALKDIPKPWFLETPDDDGGYKGPSRIDPDIAFWKAFEKAGKKLYCAPECRVGHAELVCSYYDENFEHKQIGTYEWMKGER